MRRRARSAAAIPALGSRQAIRAAAVAVGDPDVAVVDERDVARIDVRLFEQQRVPRIDGERGGAPQTSRDAGRTRGRAQHREVPVSFAARLWPEYGVASPPIYIFSRGLWNKNTKPVTRPRRAAMMGRSALTPRGIAHDPLAFRRVRWRGQSFVLQRWVLACQLRCAGKRRSVGRPRCGYRSAREQWHAPGLAVAIVKDDQVVYLRGFGTKHLGRNDPVDAHTAFTLASTAKAFTAMALGCWSTTASCSGTIRSCGTCRSLASPIRTSRAK